MKYVIEIESKESIEWLRSLVNNSMARVMREAPVNLQITYNQLADWHKGLEGIEAVSTPHEVTITAPQKVKKTASKKTRGRKKKDVDPYVCDNHPNRSGQRAPTDECIKCWDIYKTLKGVDQYRLAWKRFTLNKKAKEKLK